MATDDAPTLWMLSGTGNRGGDSYFSATTRLGRGDHPEDMTVRWDHPAPDDVLEEGQVRLAVTGWDRAEVWREYARLWAERYDQQDRDRRAVLVAQAAARKAAQPPRTWRRSGW